MDELSASLIVRHYRHTNSDATVRWFCNIYKVSYNGGQIRVKPDEVEQVEWWSTEEILERQSQGDKLVYYPSVVLSLVQYQNESLMNCLLFLRC